MRKALDPDGFTGEFFQFFCRNFSVFVSTFSEILLKIPTEDCKKIGKESKMMPMELG